MQTIIVSSNNICNIFLLLLIISASIFTSLPVSSGDRFFGVRCPAQPPRDQQQKTTSFNRGNLMEI